MSNLIPEKRVDRNGRVVTRHVSASPATNASRRSIPGVAPLTSSVDQVLEFQKLNSFYGAGTVDHINMLYPVASTIVKALECGDSESIRDLFRDVAGTPEWVESFASTCHFIQRANGTNDAQTFHKALEYASRNFGIAHQSLPSQGETMKRQVDTLLKTVNTSRFVSGALDLRASARAEKKCADLMEYLCTRSKNGTLLKSIPAISSLDGYLDFKADQHDSEPALSNLNYRGVIELMEHVMEETNVPTEYVIRLLHARHHRADDVKRIIDAHAGADVLIEGTL